MATRKGFDYILATGALEVEVEVDEDTAELALDDAVVVVFTLQPALVTVTVRSVLI